MQDRLCLPEVDEKALTGLKFSEALPRHLAVATLAARLADLITPGLCSWSGTVRALAKVFATTPADAHPRCLLLCSVSDLDRPFCHDRFMARNSVTPRHHLMIMVSSVAGLRSETVPRLPPGDGGRHLLAGCRDPELALRPGSRRAPGQPRGWSRTRRMHQASEIRVRFNEEIIWRRVGCPCFAERETAPTRTQRLCCRPCQGTLSLAFADGTLLLKCAERGTGLRTERAGHAASGVQGHCRSFSRFQWSGR